MLHIKINKKITLKTLYNLKCLTSRDALIDIFILAFWKKTCFFKSKPVCGPTNKRKTKQPSECSNSDFIITVKRNTSLNWKLCLNVPSQSWNGEHEWIIYLPNTKPREVANKVLVGVQGLPAAGLWTCLCLCGRRGVKSAFWSSRCNRAPPCSENHWGIEARSITSGLKSPDCPAVLHAAESEVLNRGNDQGGRTKKKKGMIFILFIYFCEKLMFDSGLWFSRCTTEAWSSLSLEGTKDQRYFKESVFMPEF